MYLNIFKLSYETDMIGSCGTPWNFFVLNETPPDEIFPLNYTVSYLGRG